MKNMSICHSLTSVSQFINSFVKNILKEFQINTLESTVLRVIADNEGITQKGIVSNVFEEKTRISKSVSKLLSLKYIERRTSENDSRAQKLYTTPLGLEVRDKFLEAFKRIDHDLFIGFTDEESRVLDKLLIKMKDNFF